MSQTTADLLASPTSLHKSRTHNRIKGRSRVRPRGRWRGRPLVVGQGLFRDALTRERKRADRFDQPFVLVLVARKPDRIAESSSWLSVVEALAAAKRDTDVLGWFEQGSVLGLIVPEIEASDASFTREIESRVQFALAARLDAERRSDFLLRVHRHVGPRPNSSTAPEDADPILGDLGPSLRARTRTAVKRALDVTAAGVLVALLSPLFLLIAALVKLKSPGPVFFKQARVGEFGKPFTMLKFRTMRVNADNAIHKAFVSQLIKGAAPDGATAANDAPFKIENDPRVTAIGRLLRKTSLDELPQLWNVLRGEMSLVGPRPPLTYEVEQYKPWHYRRVLEAKPGITGLWQVSGRSRTTFDDMVRLDLRYAKNNSAWTDIKILLATPRAVMSGKGAC
jgi:lipopolysaccharide/colanic/teichoic acid biosynthesis glycosyltransferase